MPVKGQAAPRSPPAHEGLPDELSEFLSKDTYSLLIKGESGTGKTILALTILRSLLPIENLLYLSTRTSPLQLVENYPWVEEVFGQPRAVLAGREKEVEGWETLVDARLDEPSVVFERITNVLMDEEAPTVVIDSWESLSDALGDEALRTNIKVLQTWRERAGARFIFVGEDPTNTTIDFMVEGVVVLKDRVAEGRRLREIVLSKLHGVQIAKPSYFFTLQGGTFASIPGYSPRDYEFRNPLPVRFDTPPGRSGSRTPTGYAPLDAHLGGGFALGSTAVVEVDRKVDQRAGLIFLSRMVQRWTAAGGRVFLQPPGDVDRRYLSLYAKSFAVGKGLLQLGDGVGDWGARAGGRGRAGRSLVIGGAKKAEKGEQRADLSVTLARKEEVDAGTNQRSAVYLKLTEIEGTLFLQCDAPSSALFAVVPGMSGGNPMMRLEPVV
jgi:KaiC/GvpD/RAD55 family RecA-like ATPase